MTVWALLCVAERRATRPNREWGYSTRRHMLDPERPAAVLPDRALYLLSFNMQVEREREREKFKREREKFIDNQIGD